MKIFICGDSTAAAYKEKETLMVGWGQVLGDYLPEVKIVNRAIAGRSTKSFLADGRLHQMDGKLHTGDLVLIQFGHNDESDKPERHTEPWTTYADNLAVFIHFARHRGAVPILLTPICIRNWEDGALQESHGEYLDAMRAVAIKLQVPLIDLYSESFRIVREAGEEGSKELYMILTADQDPRYPLGLNDNTHTRMKGAQLFAACVARDLRQIYSFHEKDKARTVQKYKRSTETHISVRRTE